MALKDALKALPRDCVVAFVVLGLTAAIALGFNAVRENRLDLVARESFDSLIFQPCPETLEEAGKASLDDLDSDGGVSFPAGAVVVDCRSPEAFDTGHIPGAVNIHYDELEGVAEQDVDRLKTHQRVIVYCDGWEDEEDPAERYTNPPSSLLADELKSQGLEHVDSLDGGLKAYLEKGGSLEKGGTP